MKRSLLPAAALAVLATLQISIAEPAVAQGARYDGPAYGDVRSRGYFSVHLGNSAFDIDCLPGSTCDDKATAGKIAVGTMHSSRFGVELAYLNFGEAQRGLAGQKAQGLNVSLVAQQAFDSGLLLFGRIGGTYGYTDTDASLPDDPSGTEQGFGISYGLGVGYRITDALDVTLEADRHRFKFADGDQDLEMLTVGVRFRY